MQERIHETAVDCRSCKLNCTRLRLSLPKTVLDATLNVDRKRTVIGDLHGRVGDHAAIFHRSRESRFNVIHQPEGSHHRRTAPTTL